MTRSAIMIVKTRRRMHAVSLRDHRPQTVAAGTGGSRQSAF
jgi:hypothetical protein